MTVLDGTMGGGGHAESIIPVIGKTGRYIGLDQDLEACELCKEKFKDFPWVSVYHGNFENFNAIIKSLHIDFLDAVILDIGISSNQLDNPERGFSFDREGPLDMRMNTTAEVSAADLVNDLSKHELADIFWRYGEERKSRQYAEAIVSARPLRTTRELVEVIEQTLSREHQKILKREGPKPPWARRHPATKVFQALRIVVNEELRVLEDTLKKIWPFIAKGGRLAVISFHSLEDRITKRQFREWKVEKTGELVTKKPIAPTREEVKENSRSRSAKLRVIKKT